MASASKRTRECKYDVFLSFRGEDNRNTFTTHLHAALSRRNIETFIDFDLTRGDEISPALLKAIENSSLSIIIFSENYASSSWCLDELLKIVECKETNEQIILPVFYHVNPADVRKQTGRFGDAFANNCEKIFKDKVSEWRAALTLVANLSGWHFDQHHGPESVLVEKIADDVLKKLNNISSGDLDGLVGIESRIETVLSLLCLDQLEDVRSIGIWGMGGIGKTTIARAIFNQIAHQFEGCCFMENVREEIIRCGLNRLKEDLLWNIIEGRNPNVKTPRLGLTFTKKRLYSKKVLIVLDDVDNSKHLKVLVGGHGWFGPGSRIIVTSRDKQVLNTCADITHALEALNCYEALQLFSLHAFKRKYVPHDYIDLSNQVVNYAKGIPLALEVWGSFLFRRQKEDWISAINKLEKSPNKEIQSIMKISYDGLDDEEKEIFLDVACFFKRDDINGITKILDGCGFSTKIGVSVLIDRCLIVINEENELLMHDLIQEMAWEVARQEFIKCPGKRSRLWEPHVTCNIFKKNTGTEAIETILLDLSKINGLQISSDAFVKMKNLRLLKFYSSRYGKNDKVVCHELKFLSNELRCIYWHRYSLKSLPSNLNLDNLVELNMPYSHLEHLWEDTPHFVNLRRVDLRHSRYLIETPNLSSARNLESIDLSGCCSITQFPKVSENVESINLCGTAIEEIPLTIGCLNKLSNLDLANCSGLKNLPDSLFQLTSLSRLSLSGCSGIDKYLENLPGSLLSGLCSLNELRLGDCNLLEIPRALCCLSSLTRLYLGGNNFESLSLKPFPYLEELDVSYCRRMQSLQEYPLPLRLRVLEAHECISLKRLPTSDTAVFGDKVSRHYLIYSNCLKLDEDVRAKILADAQLRIQAEAMKNYLRWRPEVRIVLPGSEIPKWFSYQNEGYTVTIELPPNCSNLVGFGLCIVVAFNDFDGALLPVICKWKFETVDGDSDVFSNWIDGFNWEEKPISVCSDHVFLFYDSTCTWVAGNNRHSRFSGYHSYRKASIEFSLLDEHFLPFKNCGVKRCGVRLLHSQRECAENSSTEAIFKF